PLPVTMLTASVAALTLSLHDALPISMKRLPAPSRATPAGKLSAAAVATPPSPAKSQVPPVPATVLIVPVVAATLRMTQLPLSAMKRLPAPSRATPAGELSSAAVAAPPSPAKPQAHPAPATVLIVPVVAATLRMTQLPLSA